MNSEFKITRKDLYDEVWSHPMIKLAKKYGISDVALGKRCRRKNIPMPGLGYWAKVQAGKKPRKKELPEPENNETITIIPFKKRTEIETNTIRSEVESLQQKAESKPPIVVPEELLNPHPLIKLTRKHLRIAKVNDRGMLSITTDECLHVSVSRKQLKRALLIMDTLLKELEKRGFTMAPLTGMNKEDTAVVIMEEKVNFSLVEIHDVSMAPLAKGQTHYMDSDFIRKPSGRLKLTIHELEWGGNGLRRSWSDGKCQRIENILNEFIDGMIVIAGKLHERTLAQQERKRKEDEARRIEEARVRRYESEKAKVNKLMEDMSNWDMSIQLRAYIKAVKKNHILKHGRIKPYSEMARWVKWAYAQADRIDPLKESRPSVLDNPPPKNHFSDIYRQYQPEPDQWYPGKKWYMRHA